MNKVQQLKYNLAQLIFVMNQTKHTFLEWARGTGKSTILGRRISDAVHEMPRSTGIIVGCTYAQIKTRTLPSTIAGLEMHGWKKDVHYLVGKKPPKSWGWPEPYEAPLDYKNSIIWYNGTVINMVSQDNASSSGRGMNVDWVIGDEAALLDETKLETDVHATNRGNLHRIAVYPDGTEREFKDCPLHHSSLLVSSTPITLKGKWIFKMEEQAMIDPDTYTFIRASSYVNAHNLGNEWLKKMKDTMPDFLYRAEILNERITQITDGFYPQLKESLHTYTSHNNNYYTNYSGGIVNCNADSDLDKDKALIVGIDWGANINCMVVCQDHAGQELKVLKNFYVKSPQIFDDLVDDHFAKYYKPHGCKEIHLFYDPTGNINTANNRLTYAEQIKKKFEQYGWQVVLRTRSRKNTDHEVKYQLWNKILREEDDNLPVVRFNIHNCKELWISMINAPAKQGRNETIRKDKKSETSKSIDQAHATHFSDTIDIVVVGMYLDRVNYKHFDGMSISLG